MASFRTIHTPRNVCLDCGHAIDAVTGPDAETPGPGDISICFYCGHIMAFADDLTVRPLTDAEAVEIAGNQQLVRMRQAIHKAAKDIKR